MIPKVIHYCWFGRNELPETAVKCISSWRKYFPEYEIKEWNEDNFDVNVIPYTKEAYAAKKYAFVSDYARFDILYRYGGLYFDTDVEVIKNFEDIIGKGPFMGCELDYTGKSDLKVAPGLGLGCDMHNSFYLKLLELYKTLKFKNEDGSINTKTIVEYTTDLLRREGLQSKDNEIQKVAGLYIYPSDFFCPKNYATGEIKITNNTCCIHHYDASWCTSAYKKMIEEKKWIYQKVSNRILRKLLTKLVVLKKIIIEKIK